MGSRGVAQTASALRLGRRGRRFKSGRPDWPCTCGRCKKVLPQPSKLLLRVRFPPPALIEALLSGW